MTAKVTKRTELGPLVALPTARHARVERGKGLSLRSTRSCAWIAVVEAHHAAIRSSSHSSMKTENWFQLRIVGGRPALRERTTAPPRCQKLCTRLASPLAMSAFPRASPPGTVPSAQSSLGYTRNGSIPQLRDVLRGEMSFGAPWSAAVARRGSAERVRAAASRSIWRS